MTDQLTDQIIEAPTTPQPLFGMQPGQEIDAATNPAMANMLGQLAMSGDMPPDPDDEPKYMPDIPDGSVTLAAGYVDADGECTRDAEVRELTGVDEEAMGKKDATGNLARFIDVIVRRGTVSIGGRDATKEMLDSLLIGDRDVLALAIRRATYGDTLRLPLVCPSCEHEFEVDYDLTDGGDIPSKPYTHGAERSVTVELTRGRSATVGLVDGAIQKIVFTNDRKNLSNAETNTLILSRTLLAYHDGRGPVSMVDRPRIARNMGMRDRAALVKAMIEAQPGPQYDDLKQECPNCAETLPLAVDYGMLFRPTD